MESGAQVVREGWLIKAPSPKSTWKKFWDTQWKRRYFVLCSGQLPGASRLLWYQDEHHRRNGKPAKGCIELQNCEQVECNLSLSYERRGKRVSHNWIFDVHVSSPKGPSVLYYFSATSEHDMNDWVQLLCRLCHLEREEDSDVSTGTERFSNYGSSTAGQRVSGQRDGAPHEPVPSDQRYVEQPRSGPATPSSPWSRPTNQQTAQTPGAQSIARQQTPSVSSHPTQSNVVPPAPFISRPPAALPLADTVSSPTEPLETKPKYADLQMLPIVGALGQNQGYIPLSDCLSGKELELETANYQNGGPRLDGITDTTTDMTPMAGLDSIDQPPSYPPPPLPTGGSITTDEGAYTNFLPPPPPLANHSRSPSKESTESSIHLSSTESDQGDSHRRPSGGSKSLATPTSPSMDVTQFAIPSHPTSPTSPPASINRSYNMRSSEGSSSVCYLTDDAQVSTPPPRPPKTSRSSTSSQQKQPFVYENEPSPVKNGDGSSAYDKLTFGNQRGIISFDSLPRTTTQKYGRLNSPSAFSTLPKHATFGESEKDYTNDGWPSTSPKSFGHESTSTDPRHNQHHRMASDGRPPLLHHFDDHHRPRTISAGAGTSMDSDSSYSPFTPGPPRLATPAAAASIPGAPSHPRPSRSPSGDADANGAGDQYQNFVPQLTRGSSSIGNGSHIAQLQHRGAPSLPEKPPEIKRDLKPPRARGPSLPNSNGTGIGQLPKMPQRLTEVKKNSLGNIGTLAAVFGGIPEKPEKTPDFNVERRVSFKSRQQTAGTPRTGTLDTEIKIEEEASLDYVDIENKFAAARNNNNNNSINTPPGTPTPRRFGHSPSPSVDQHMYHVSSSFSSSLKVSSPIAPGYVQIDPQATEALRRAQADVTAKRNLQHATLEKDRNAANGQRKK